MRRFSDLLFSLYLFLSYYDNLRKLIYYNSAKILEFSLLFAVILTAHKAQSFGRMTNRPDSSSVLITFTNALSSTFRISVTSAGNSSDPTTE